MLYILDDKNNIVPMEDTLHWGRWLEDAKNSGRARVAEDHVDDIRISTIFMGVDYNPFPVGGPAVFETMIFNAGAPGQIARYSDWEAAAQGHAEILECVRAEHVAAGEATVEAIQGLLSKRREG